MTTPDDQQPIGHRKKREISPYASGESLRESALFNTEIQKLLPPLNFPMGVYRYKTHEEADRHWMECCATYVAAVRKLGLDTYR